MNQKNKNKINRNGNMKQKISKENLSSKIEETNNDESILTNAKSNLSLRKFIFSKCSNPTSNTNNAF